MFSISRRVLLRAFALAVARVWFSMGSFGLLMTFAGRARCTEEMTTRECSRQFTAEDFWVRFMLSLFIGLTLAEAAEVVMELLVRRRDASVVDDDPEKRPLLA
jgi:ABC-type sulfate transport system permease component